MCSAAFSYTRTSIAERYAFASAMEHPTATKHHKQAWEWLIDNTPDFEVTTDHDLDFARRKRNKMSHGPSTVDSAAAGSAADPRSSTVDSPPEWVTFQRDAHNWYHELAGAGVDEPSIRVLFLLSQHSDRGWQEANRIIHKIFKDTAGKGKAKGKGFDNVSAFVSKAVNNARRELDHEEWYSSGWRW